MKITDTHIPEVKMIEPTVFENKRVFFIESFNQKVFENAVGAGMSFVQDNHSLSHKGVIRGLHYQLPPHAQGKLVRVTQGEVFDVAVDIRKSSSTYGQWVAEILSSTNKKQLWIPEGFAHGFMTLSDKAEFLYKTTSYYMQESERSIHWNDDSIGIRWPQQVEINISEKDAIASILQHSETFP